MEDSFEFLIDDRYYITMTDNVFDFLENSTEYYDIIDPYEWVYSPQFNFTYTIKYLFNYKIF